MKHNINVTILMILIYLCAQIIGLVIISQYVNIEESSRTGKTVSTEIASVSPGGEPPQVDSKDIWKMVLGILFAVLIGTALILLLIKLRMPNLIKVWLFIAVAASLSKAFFPFIYNMIQKFLADMVPFSIYITIGLAILLTFFKIYRTNIYIHNITEIFLYGGLASYIVPVLNLFWAAVLLILISIYDMYAVWKSKHMVKLAKFQSEANSFAGLLIPYEKTKTYTKKKLSAKPIAKKQESKFQQTSYTKVSKDEKVEESGTKKAILGGGDIAFPLIFSGALMATYGNLFMPLIVTATTTGALAALLIFGKSNRFYPAMPFISAGAFLGYGIVLII